VSRASAAKGFMSNPYAPPRDFDEGEERRTTSLGRSAQFHHVSTTTLAALQIVTFGLYAVIWFYRHWAVQKRARRLNISPVARGIFAIFFVHRLFKVIDQTARATGVSTRWKHRSQATLYVLLVLVARVLSNLTSDVEAILVGIALNVASVFPLVAAQRVANLANGRPFLEDDDDYYEDDEASVG
jgi:hypothetical protein